MRNKYNIKMAGPWITNHERQKVNQMMKNDWENYNYVEKFEKDFAAWHNRKYCLMTTCCTHAIHLLLLALGVNSGDEVIVPECTWTGSAAPITYVGAKPVFVDISKNNWCLDPNSIEKKISKKTKAIISVDLYGNMPDYKKIIGVSKKYNIPIIEDAAEALGSKYKNVRAGKFGIAGVHSFHRTKTICTGEGGALLIDNKKLYLRAKFLRDHGRSKKIPYYTLEATPKYMPNNLQASLACAQLDRVNELVKRKRQIFLKYKKKLSTFSDLQFNIDNSQVYNGVWATSIVFGKSFNLSKNKIINELKKMDVPVRPFFYPLSSLPAYKKYKSGNYRQNPVAYDISNRAVTLPSHYNLSNRQINHICNSLIKLLSKA